MTRNEMAWVSRRPLTAAVVSIAGKRYDDIDLQSPIIRVERRYVMITPLAHQIHQAAQEAAGLQNEIIREVAREM